MYLDSNNPSRMRFSEKLLGSLTKLLDLEFNGSQLLWVSNTGKMEGGREEEYTCMCVAH